MVVKERVKEEGQTTPKLFKEAIRKHIVYTYLKMCVYVCTHTYIVSMKFCLRNVFTNSLKDSSIKSYTKGKEMYQ